MLTGKPDAGNPHVRFDEGEQRDWRKPPVVLYSTGFYFSFEDNKPAGHPLRFSQLFLNRMPAKRNAASNSSFDLGDTQLPKLLIGELSVASATGKRDLEIQHD